MAKEQISLLYNTAYGDLIITVNTIITLSKQRMLFVSIQNVYRVNTWTCFNYQLNAQFLYSIIIYMLHYNPRNVSSSTMPIFRRSNSIITASGIVTLCKRLYSTPVESRLCLISTGLLYMRLQRVTILDAVIIQFGLLKMGMVLLETCLGL